jgi:general secretion pathway protein B
MSYILDALRRAEHERERELERGQVPGLHAQAVAAPPEPARSPRSAALGGVAVGAGVGAAAVLAWWMLMGRGAAPIAAPVAPPTPPPASAMEAAPGTTAATQPQPVPSAGAGSVPAKLPMPPLVVSSVPAPAHASASAPRPGIGVAPAVPQAVPLARLSHEQRLGLPPLVMGGSIWSEGAANRFVIIDGQVVREGEEAAPGLVLERIEPKAAVLRWRDLRIEVPF